MIESTRRFASCKAPDRGSRRQSPTRWMKPRQAKQEEMTPYCFADAHTRGEGPIRSTELDLRMNFVHIGRSRFSSLANNEQPEQVIKHASSALPETLLPLLSVPVETLKWVCRDLAFAGSKPLP